VIDQGTYVAETHSSIGEGPPSTQQDAALAVSADGLGKLYHLYSRPSDRLKQALWGRRRSFGREFWAIRDLSFDIRPGESVGIVGRNGSGKSTLLQVLAGVLRPTTGRAHVSGRVVALLELGSGFSPELSGRQNVYLNAAALGIGRSEIDARFDEIAAFAEIGEFIDYPVKLYSTGMVIRLAFAVQTVLNPDLFIIDEALSVGDFPFQRRSVKHLERFMENGGTILLTTHDMSLVQRVCTRVLVLHAGRLVIDDEPTIATHQYVTRYSQLTAHSTDTIVYPSLPQAPTSVDMDVDTFLAGAIHRPPKSDFLSRDVEILGVRVENERGVPCLIFRPHQVMVVRTLFRVNVQKPFVSNGLLLSEPGGTLIWGGGAVNQRKILEVGEGKCYISTIEVTLSLGPGHYFLTVGLATPLLSNNARTGEFHDRFVDAAQIEIGDFDLDDNEPIPFWGIANLRYRLQPLYEVPPLRRPSEPSIR
jgi:lipopolysaccharide transport system ATP-binding protein